MQMILKSWKINSKIFEILKSENHCVFRDDLLPLDSVFRKKVKYLYNQLGHIKNLVNSHFSFSNFCHTNFWAIASVICYCISRRKVRTKAPKRAINSFFHLVLISQNTYILYLKTLENIILVYCSRNNILQKLKKS